VKYHHEIEGRNSRLDGIQAAVLSVKLPHLEEWSEKRRRHARVYSELLADLEDVITPREAPWALPVYHLYVVRVPHRDALQKRLAERGISTAMHYPFSLPTATAYRYLGHASYDFPVANGQMGQLLSLPMYPELTDDVVRTVVDGIREELAALVDLSEPTSAS
jgi:dTDP-4-amino-4,6-dideoxygalactose transaminase